MTENYKHLDLVASWKNSRGRKTGQIGSFRKKVRLTCHPTSLPSICKLERRHETACIIKALHESSESVRHNNHKGHNPQAAPHRNFFFGGASSPHLCARALRVSLQTGLTGHAREDKKDPLFARTPFFTPSVDCLEVWRTGNHRGKLLLNNSLRSSSWNSGLLSSSPPSRPEPQLKAAVSH